MQSRLKTQAAWAKAHVTDTFSYECVACGFKGDGGVTSSVMVMATGSGWFVSSARREAAENAALAASAEAWSTLVDAVELAPCPRCDAVDVEKLRGVRRRLLSRSLVVGCMLAVPFGLLGLTASAFRAVTPGILLASLALATCLVIGHLRVKKR